LEYIVFGQAQQNENYTNTYNEIIFYHFREGGNPLFMQYCCFRGIPAYRYGAGLLSSEKQG
jgi:hypothetical protein